MKCKTYMEVSSFRHGHLLNMNSEGGHTKLIVVVSAGTRSVVFVTVSTYVGGDEDGGDIFRDLVSTIDSFEKMLK